MSAKQSTAQRYWLAAAGIAVLLLFVIGSSSWPRQTTVVLVIRHAEKVDNTKDSPLTDDGRARAQELVHVAQKAGVAAIYATEILRTQLTVQPLAARLGLAVTQVDHGDTDGLISRIWRDHRGQVILVAGHSPTVPEIIEKLGGGSIAPITEDRYDNLFMVIIPWLGSAKTVHLKYGKPTPPVAPAS
jgi:phosphohistidine phosphatase SixA